MMTELTPEEKLKAAIEDKFHAAIINDEGTRKTFIKTMTTENDPTDAEMETVFRFINAVDYMLGTIGFGICDIEVEVEGGPIPLSDMHLIDTPN